MRLPKTAAVMLLLALVSTWSSMASSGEDYAAAPSILTLDLVTGTAITWLILYGLALFVAWIARKLGEQKAARTDAAAHLARHRGDRGEGW